MKWMRPLPDMTSSQWRRTCNVPQQISSLHSLWWWWGIENHLFQYLRTSKQKNYWQYAWVFTQLDVWIRWMLSFWDMLQWIVISNLCVLQPKIRNVRIIRPCFSNSGDNTAVSQLCNFSYKTTLLPPKQFSCWTYIYARILNWAAFIVLPSSYARILSWVAFIVLPSSLPAQITPLFSSCARGL